MKTITLRDIPPELAQALAHEADRRGQSLNRTAIDLMRQGLRVGTPRSNGLARFAGTWPRARAREFQRLMEPFGEIDPELWD